MSGVSQPIKMCDEGKALFSNPKAQILTPRGASQGLGLQINDRYEFPDVLDLDCGDRKYLSPTADSSVRNK